MTSALNKVFFYAQIELQCRNQEREAIQKDVTAFNNIYSEWKDCMNELKLSIELFEIKLDAQFKNSKSFKIRILLEKIKHRMNNIRIALNS